jgi:hypothetical protein
MKFSSLPLLEAMGHIPPASSEKTLAPRELLPQPTTETVVTLSANRLMVPGVAFMSTTKIMLSTPETWFA